MRENIGIFRGKDTIEHKWRYGNLTVHGDTAQIWEETEQGLVNYLVDPETVGEFTGQFDKNGLGLFEGDVVSYFGKDFLNSLVTFDKGSFWFEFLSEYTRKIRNQKRDLIFSNVSICGEIIGNIHDNPELNGDKDT